MRPMLRLGATNVLRLNNLEIKMLTHWLLEDEFMGSLGLQT